MGENVHSGHRNRMRDRFRSSSLQSMQEHEQLELLLFYAIPRCNTNETAHHLLNTFGSIGAVIDAPLEEIERVPGVGAGAGTFFRLLRELIPIYAKQHSEEKLLISRPTDAAKVLMRLYTYLEAEALTLILLNAKRRVIFAGLVNSGKVDSVQADLRHITRMALSYDAAAVILGHNHPSGSLMPSPNDIQSTVMAHKSLRSMGIDLLDHIIVGADNFHSMAENKEFSELGPHWNPLNDHPFNAAYNLTDC